jgi:hypothetical protein
MKKFTRLVTLLFSAAVLFTACQKDLSQYSKISMSKWKPDIAVPIATSTITFRDIIGNDSGIIANADSSLVYVYHQDSIFSISADSLMQFLPNITQQHSFSLGALKFNNFSDSSTITVNDILPYIDAQTADTLRAKDGTSNIFPPFHLNSNFTMDMTDLNNFDSLTFSHGTLNITATNRLPVQIDTISYDLTDLSNGKVIKSITIYNLAPNASDMQTVNLAGKTLSNRFRVIAHVFGSKGSYPDSVMINLSKGITFVFNAENLRVVSGSAVIPQQEAFTRDKMLDINTENGERLYMALFSSGKMNYTITSKLNIGITANLTFPTALKDNHALTENISVPAHTPVSRTLDLAGYAFDLETDPTQKYNRLPVHFMGDLLPTQHPVVFDSSDRVTVTFHVNNIQMASVRGYFGKQTYQIDETGFSFNLDFLGKLKGNLAFTNPKLEIHYRNDFGVPIKAKLYMKAFKNETGKTQNLNFDSVIFKHPTVEGQKVYGTIEISKDNSSIVDFLSLLPDSISTHGGFITNPSGMETNFIDRNSVFTADADLRFPFSFKTDGINFTDTVNDVHISPDDIPADSGTIYVGISNGLPFDITASLAFPDSVTGETLRTLDIGTIHSATVSGNTNTPTKSVLKISIPYGFFDDIQKANSMIIHLSISTYNNGTVPVQVYSDDKVKITLSASAKMKP